MRSITDDGHMTDHEDKRRPCPSESQKKLACQLVNHENSEITLNINDSFEELMDASSYKKHCK